MNYSVVFFTGLTSGALSCVALQGGLLASAIAAQKQQEAASGSTDTTSESAVQFDRRDWVPTALFLFSKLVSHTLLGFFLGWLGSYLEMSLGVRLAFQTLAAVFVLAAAANLLELHPAFRFVLLQPPRWLQRMVRRQSKDASWLAPVFLGLFTVFIPCGVTQAMEVLAISSGSAWSGALIMFLFVLGTTPLFATVGLLTARLSERFQQPFRKVAATLLILLALSNLNGVLTVLDSPLSFQRLTAPITYFFSEERIQDNLKQRSASNLVEPTNGVQRVLIEAKSNGYSPRYVQVRAGIPVELTVETRGVYSCASAFVFPTFNVQFQLGPNDRQTALFTPTQPGKYQFSCSMGMYTGVMEVL